MVYGICYLEHMVESGQGFDKKVAAFVVKFITASSEEIQRFVQIETHMPNI
jgi:hypothetical protein